MDAVSGDTVAASDRTDVLFAREGDHLSPTVCAVGPWRPDAAHGSAVAALFGAALEDSEMTVARVTMDILGAVRLKTLRLEVGDVHGGRRVRRRSAVLFDDERPVARATALYMNGAPIEVPAPSIETGGRAQPTTPPAELALLPESRAGWPGFENRAMALHTTGDRRTVMRGWFRLLVPALDDHPVSGVQMALAAADYTSGGTLLVVSMKRFMFQSTDLTVNLARRPRGDWIGLAAGPSIVAETGVGIAASMLHDEEGVFGRCAQTQLVEPLPEGPLK